MEKVDTTFTVENARDKGGYRRFTAFDVRGGTEVADTARLAEQARKVKPRSKDGKKR